MTRYAVVLGAILYAVPVFAQNHTADVVQAKADLQQAGVDLAGPCGAVKIANLVAWRLRPTYALLVKAGGNRAVLREDGSCVSGDQTREPGYATDYLIDRATGFGYDLLSDGGGSNGAQWAGPEMDPGAVNRNFANAHEPVDPAAYLHATIPTPVATTPLSPAAVVLDLSSVQAQLAQIVAMLNEHVRADADAHTSISQNITDGRNESRPVLEALKSVLTFTSKYVLPAVAGYFTAKKIG